MTKTNKATVPQSRYISVDVFLKSAATVYQFEDIQAKAFKIRMKKMGKTYLPNLESFIPYFEEYLGISKREGN
jgi:hypothetical protein